MRLSVLSQCDSRDDKDSPLFNRVLISSKWQDRSFVCVAVRALERNWIANRKTCWDLLSMYLTEEKSTTWKYARVDQFNWFRTVREYEKTGLEGFSGFALVPDCCHIVATVYCSGMDNHCVIFTIFLDHDLCIFMAFCSRPHGSMNVRCRYPCVKLWEMGRTPSSGEPLEPRIGRHHSSSGFKSLLCIEVRELWGVICRGTRSVPSQWSRHTRDSCHIRTTFITF